MGSREKRPTAAHPVVEVPVVFRLFPGQQTGRQKAEKGDAAAGDFHQIGR